MDFHDWKSVWMNSEKGQNTTSAGCSGKIIITGVSFSFLSCVKETVYHNDEMEVFETYLADKISLALWG